MSKRAANTLWERADQVDQIKRTIVELMFEHELGADELREAIVEELGALNEIVLAMRDDSQTERDYSDGWKYGVAYRQGKRGADLESQTEEGGE